MLIAVNPVVIDLEVTSLCNAVCTFCPRSEMTRQEKFLDLEVVKSLCRQIEQEDLRQEVVLCGIGESILHPQIHEIIRLLRAAGASVSMTTNGKKVDAAALRRLVDSGLQEISFSINASQPSTHRKVMKMDGYRDVISNAKNAIRQSRSFEDFQTNISFVLCRENFEELDEFIDEWRAAKPSSIYIHPLNNRANLVNAELSEVRVDQVAVKYANDPIVIVDIFSKAGSDTGICKIASKLDFISSDGDLLLCALDYAAVNRIGNLATNRIQDLRARKIQAYANGDFDSFCESCSFCPKPSKVEN